MLHIFLINFLVGSLINFDHFRGHGDNSRELFKHEVILLVDTSLTSYFVTL